MPNFKFLDSMALELQHAQKILQKKKNQQKNICQF